MLLAVAVFPPGAKKREKRDEEPKGNRVGNWTEERWTSNRGICPGRSGISSVPICFPHKNSLLKSIDCIRCQQS